MNNIVAGYYFLLRQAFEASEAADRYDLRSDLPESVAVWEELKARDLAAQQELVAYLNMHGTTIATALGVTDHPRTWESPF